MEKSPDPLVGTSGYNYPEWRGNFYPEGLPSKEMFGYYSGVFATVEINYTFYRMPTEKMAAAWEAQAPDGFKYALKAPQRITHMKRLMDCEEPLQFFCDSARVLGEHLGPLLFQLPPNFRCDLARLEKFLAIVPRDLRAAFEFRHDSWLLGAGIRTAGRPRSRALHRRFRRQDDARTRDRAARLLPAAGRGLHAGGSRTVGDGA